MPLRNFYAPYFNNFITQLTSLIPALDSSGDAVQNNGEVQCLRVSPAVSDLHENVGTFTVFEPIDFVQVAWVLGQ